MSRVLKMDLGVDEGTLEASRSGLDELGSSVRSSHVVTRGWLYLHLTVSTKQQIQIPFVHNGV